MSFELRPMAAGEWLEVARLIYDSTNAWYEANGKPAIFCGPQENALLFCEVYEDLDPGCCVVAVHRETSQIAASCFYHPRPTHVSLGIMNVHPSFFGQGLAGRLLHFITELADQQQKPTRLVSSAMNLDSFSLYNRAGFVPQTIYQDMTVLVPETGFAFSETPNLSLRAAQPMDVPAIVALERSISGIERGKDFDYFIQNRRGIWRMSVAETADGTICGFLASVCHPGSNMIGPGAATDESTAIALLIHQLNQHRGRQPVWLVPSACRQVIKAMYELGARNCEIHFGQVRGEAQLPCGVTLPTFMPETA